MINKKTIRQRKMGKKAVFMGIYLPLITLFMCGLVIGFYFLQQTTIENSIILPTSLLDLQNSKYIFEMQEKEIICVSANEAGWSNEQEIKNKFFDYLVKDEQEQFRDFLFSDLKFEGQEISKDSFIKSESQIAFFNKIYEFNFESNQLKVVRKSLTKYLYLRAPEAYKKNFPVEAEYVYEKTYLLEKGDC